MASLPSIGLPKSVIIGLVIAFVLLWIFLLANMFFAGYQQAKTKEILQQVVMNIRENYRNGTPEGQYIDAGLLDASAVPRGMFTDRNNNGRFDSGELSTPMGGLSSMTAIGGGRGFWVFFMNVSQDSCARLLENNTGFLNGKIFLPESLKNKTSVTHDQAQNACSATAHPNVSFYYDL